MLGLAHGIVRRVAVWGWKLEQRVFFKQARARLRRASRSWKGAWEQNARRESPAKCKMGEQGAECGWKLLSKSEDRVRGPELGTRQLSTSEHRASFLKEHQLRPATHFQEMVST